MDKTDKKIAKKVSIYNRKASFEFELLEEFNAGIILFGSEVKSIRAGNVSITESYCYVNNKEVFIKNMNIPLLKNAVLQHEPMRDRKLLLTKKEVNKIILELKNKGIALVPTHMYNKKGLIKIQIKLGKGKKLYDKRLSIKEKDVEREFRRGEL